MRTLLLTALFSASTLTIHARALPAQDGRTRLEVTGVLAVGDADDGGALVILREQGGRTLLPMLVPGEAGRALAAEIQSHRTPALLGVTLRALGARVQEIELQGSGDEVQGGRARVAQGPKVVDVAGRPPELVALAAATGAPILIDRRLLRAAGLTPEDIRRARQRLEAHEKELSL